MRNRHSLCLNALENRFSVFDAQCYDEVFWGSPDDWDEVTMSTQHTIANILYRPGNCPAIEEEVKSYGYPCVFASFWDDFYTIKSYASGEFSDWETTEHLTSYNENAYRTNLNKYTDNLPEKAHWIIVGGLKHRGHEPRKCGAPPIYKLRTPCLTGVAIHADLTWRNLEIHIHDTSRQCIISKKLPKWGIGNYLESLNDYFCKPVNECTLKQILAGNITQQLISEDGLQTVHPDELQVSAYLKRLLHLLPYSPECNIRLTGWFSSDLVANVTTMLLKDRYRDLLFSYPYKTWQYE